MKGILPILKIDNGLAPLEDGVQLMKPICNLDELLIRAKKRNIFAAKMRSVIKEADPKGIANIVEQQFALGHQIALANLLPVLEPEIDIHATDKKTCEELLKKELHAHLAALDERVSFMFKLTLPEEADFYHDLIDDSHVIRVIALSGGYSRKEANEKLALKHDLIASFSRALTEGLHVDQSDDEFYSVLKDSIQSIYNASIS